MNLIDPDFDPYLELQETKVEVLRHQRTIHRLTIGHNHNQQLIADLVDQNRQLLNLVKSHKYCLDAVELEVKQLRSLISQ